MTHTHTSNFIHRIFSTKDRRFRLPMPFYLAAALLFFSLQSLAQPPRANEHAGQNVFGLDGSFDNRDLLPSSVVEALISSRQASPIRGWMRAKNDSDASSYFLAKEVQLAAPGETDYVVLGRLPGADCLHFWVVHSEQGRPKVVLFDSTLSLEVLTSRTNGLRDIQTVWQSPNEAHTKIFHFDGKRYQLASQNWKDGFGK
jgi:hypothetical protein